MWGNVGPDGIQQYKKFGKVGTGGAFPFPPLCHVSDTFLPLHERPKSRAYIFFSRCIPCVARVSELSEKYDLPIKIPVPIFASVL